MSILSGPHLRTIRYLAWSHDGRYLASSSFDCTLGIWERQVSYDNNDCSSEDQWKCLVTLDGHDNEIKCCAWSPTDLYLTSCARDRTVWIWEKIEIEEDETQEQKGPFIECNSVLSEHTQDVKHCKWHPSLNVLASAGFDNQIILYNSTEDDWQAFARLNAHESTVWAVDFDAKGARLVSVSADQTIKIWHPKHFCDVVKFLDSIETISDEVGIDIKTQMKQAQGFASLAIEWTVITSLSGYHRWPIYDVSWSALNDMIATAGADNSIHIFGDVNKLESEEAKNASSAMPRYRQLCFANQAHQQDVNSVHWNPKTSQLLASASDDGIIRIWRIEKSQ